MAFHTDDPELWKDSGLHRMTMGLINLRDPSGPISVLLDSESVCHRGALALFLLTLPLFQWPNRQLICPQSSIALMIGTTLPWKEHRKTTPSAPIILG